MSSKEGVIKLTRKVKGVVSLRKKEIKFNLLQTEHDVQQLTEKFSQRLLETTSAQLVTLNAEATSRTGSKLSTHVSTKRLKH